MAKRKTFSDASPMCPLGKTCMTFTKGRVSSRKVPVVTESLYGTKLHAEPQSSKKPCQPSKGKALGPCRTEIMFLGPDRAKKIGSEPGVHLRFCVAQEQQGPVVRVKDHAQAKELGDRFCSLVKAATAEARERVAKEISSAAGSPGYGALKYARRLQGAPSAKRRAGRR